MTEKSTETLRHATLGDVDAILDMAKRLYEGSVYETISVDYVRARQMLERFIIEGNKEFLVMLSHDKGKPVGVIAAYAFQPLFSSEKVATECLLWLEPEYRTSARGKELLDAYEYWAKLIGVSVVQYGLLASADPRLAAFYNRRGAVEVEKVYYKDLR
jgi:GNAT superfamily N-acetyltransferase